MDTLLQGSGGLEDWIEIIVLVLIFGGSALGAMAKWIIGKLNPEAAEKEGESAPVSPKRQAAPTRPVARPMPPVATPAHPVARPMAPPAAARPQPYDTPRRPAPKPVRTPSPRPVAPTVPPVVVRVDRPATTSAAPPARKVKRRKPKTTARKPKRDFEEQGHREFERIDHEVWDVDTPDSKADTVTAEVCDEFDPIRRPTRRALRQAIIMKEILGPPLSLRPRDESF